MIVISELHANYANNEMVLYKDKVQALSGFYQSYREIQAILKDSIFRSLFEKEKILSITRSERGYIIETNFYHMEFVIQYGGNQNNIGPIPFTAHLEMSSIEQSRTKTVGGRYAEDLLDALEEKTAGQICPSNYIQKVLVTETDVSIIGT